MIEHPGWIRVGRDEVPNEDTRPLFDRLAALRDRAYAAWLDRYPDERGLWHRWHTMGLVGPFGKWHTVDFEMWAGFGRDLAPVLQHRLRYVVANDQVDPVAPPVDPPLLHQSSRVITPGTLTRLFKMEDRMARGAYDKLLNAEAQLLKEGLLDPHHAPTRTVWMRMLAQQGVRIEGSLPGKISVRRDDRAVSLWEVDPGLEQDQSVAHRRSA